MHADEQTKKSLALCSNCDNEVFTKLIENCFAVLLRKPEIYDIVNLQTSSDVVKEVYPALLTVAAQFARHNLSSEPVAQFLIDECGFSKEKAESFSNSYATNKLKLQVILGNVGTHLPHITDVKWKIDYIVKTSNLIDSDGPLFRIALLTEVYDNTIKNKKVESVEFTCTSQELQDLVYKLKDAVRHCHRLVAEH